MENYWVTGAPVANFALSGSGKKTAPPPRPFRRRRRRRRLVVSSAFSVSPPPHRCLSRLFWFFSPRRCRHRRRPRSFLAPRNESRTAENCHRERVRTNNNATSRRRNQNLRNIPDTSHTRRRWTPGDFGGGGALSVAPENYAWVSKTGPVRTTRSEFSRFDSSQ